MSPMAKRVIEKLSNEEDTQLLAEVLDFYEYVKQKKEKQLWADIKEVEPQEDEKKICEEYSKANQEFIDLNQLIQELELDE